MRGSLRYPHRTSEGGGAGAAAVSLTGITTARAGEVVHVPEDVPGLAEAVEETSLVAVTADTA